MNLLPMNVLPMNLLVDPLFRVATADSLERHDLPTLLQALGEDRVESLPGLQRHQEDAFHIFLCYLAGAVLARENRDDPRQDADFWREGIRRLTRADGGVDDSAWTLLVEDPTRPAFMQTRTHAAEAYREQFKTQKADSPDEFDLLVTAKNHDVKMKRVRSQDLEAWTYALINLQTMTCYLGSGQYGVARSSGGTGPRVRVGLLHSLRSGALWLSDVNRLNACRSALIQGPLQYSASGVVLTWLPAWDLETSLNTTELDPFFIEVSRGVRLERSRERVLAKGASTAPLVLTKATRDKINGRMGDPWIPIDLAKEAALNVRGEGFPPERIRDLIFLAAGDTQVYTPAAMQTPESARWPDCHFYAAALARRGKDSNTDGFHSALLKIPNSLGRSGLFAGPLRDYLAEVSRTAIADSGTMQNRVLKPAVFSVLQAGPKQVNFDKREIADWWKETENAFTSAWRTDFFPWLWSTAESQDPESARLDWLRSLQGKAESALADAIARYPSRGGRKYRAQVAAWQLFRGSLRNQFPALAPASDEKTDEITDED